MTSVQSGVKEAVELAVERAQQSLDEYDRGHMWAVAPNVVRMLLTGLAELQAAKWDVKHVDTMNDAVSRGMVIDDQAAEIARLKAALSSQAEVMEAMASALTFIAGEKNDGGDQAWNGSKWVPIREIARTALSTYRSLNGDA